MPDSLTEDDLLRDLSNCEAVRIELAVDAEVDGEGVRIGAPFANGSLVGREVQVRDVPVRALVGQSWRVWGRIDSEGYLEIERMEIEPARSAGLHTSRSSRRLERPNDCVARIRAADSAQAVDAECLDISAGGCGLHTVERGSFSIAEIIDVELEIRGEHFEMKGFVAHAERARVGLRLGVQFAPLPEADAARYYAVLNDLAGEPIADIRPTEHSVPRFYEALRRGSLRAGFDAPGSVVGGVFRLQYDSVAQLLASVRELGVDAEDGNWSASLQHVSEGRFAIRQVGHPELAQESRGSGYRVAPPRDARLRVRRRGNGGVLQVELLDLSRGGLGLRLAGPISLGPRERVDIEFSTGEFAQELSGNVVYMRPDEGAATRVGIAFVGVDASQREALDGLVSQLEDREVQRRLVLIGVAAFAFLFALIVLGSLVSPDRVSPEPPPDSPAPQTHE